MTYAVVTPSRGLVHSRTVEAVMANVAEVPGFAGWALTHDLPIPDCDEHVTELGLATGAELLWFVEEDVIPPAGALAASLALLGSGFDVAAVDYPVGAPEDGWGCAVVDSSGAVEWCGLGATLIRRSVLEALPRPWFSTEYRWVRNGSAGPWREERAVGPNASRYGQQDIYFCMRARAAGIRLGLVPGVLARHARLDALGGQGTNVGFHTITVRDRIARQYPGVIV